MQDNIKQFNEVSAIIFNYLYDNFPKPVSMKMHELVGGEIDTDELYVCKKTEFARDVVNWLREEGFIKAGGGNFAFYSQCILTAQGLDALNSVPASLGGKESIISKIKSGIASGSSEAIKAAIAASVQTLASHSF